MTSFAFTRMTVVRATTGDIPADPPPLDLAGRKVLALLRKRPGEFMPVEELMRRCEPLPEKAVAWALVKLQRRLLIESLVDAVNRPGFFTAESLRRGSLGTTPEMSL